MEKCQNALNNEKALNDKLQQKILRLKNELEGCRKDIDHCHGHIECELKKKEKLVCNYENDQEQIKMFQKHHMPDTFFQASLLFQSEALLMLRYF